MKLAHEYNEGLIKLPIYDASSLTKGQGLKWGTDGSSTSTCALIDVADTGADIFAVLAETPATTTTNVQTPIIYQAQVRLVDNVKIWRIYYDLSTSTDLDVSSSTSTVITVASCDDNLDGSWVYINSGTGAGQLRYVKGANTTTLTVNTAFTTTPDSTSDFILIRNVGRPTDGVALNATFEKIVPILAESSSTNMIILKNFIEGPTGVQELDITANSQLESDGLNTRGVRFFSLVCFADTAIHAQGIS